MLEEEDWRIQGAKEASVDIKETLLTPFSGAIRRRQLTSLDSEDVGEASNTTADSAEKPYKEVSKIDEEGEHTPEGKCQSSPERGYKEVNSTSSSVRRRGRRRCSAIT